MEELAGEARDSDLDKGFVGFGSGGEGVTEEIEFGGLEDDSNAANAAFAISDRQELNRAVSDLRNAGVIGDRGSISRENHNIHHSGGARMVF